jgi:NAD(P)-dependent dehydrogenase (short-subunit alcohol dehydrogenase family)
MLEGKVCVVTGAGQGIGRATAIEAARQGGKVATGSRGTEKGEETVRMIKQEGGEAMFLACDVRDGEQVRALMDAAAERFGGIDVLFNNAAVHETELSDETRIDLISEEVWNQVYEVNLRGVWYCIKHAAPYLRRSAAGAIVNVGSVASHAAYPMSPCYAATKGAILQLTKTAAIDFADDGIRCNCFSPGATETSQVAKYIETAEDKEAIMNVLTGTHLISRLGDPFEQAKVACFLASDDASFITGADILVDGGALAWRGTNA